MTDTLYTFGYLSAKAERTITELITVKTPIIDVRYSPTSKHYCFTQESMRTRAGIDYYHIQTLGNTLYKEALTGEYKEPHIQIAYLDAGLQTLHTLLEQHHRAAIFCACTSKTKCHRVHVANEYKARYSVQIVHL